MRPWLFAAPLALLYVTFAGRARADACTESAGDTSQDAGIPCADNAPICVQGTCVGCAADFGTGSAVECPTSANPYCTGSGADAGALDAGEAGVFGPGGTCGKCGDFGGNSACTQTNATHAGPVCETSGACGLGCAADNQCTAMQFCEGQTGTCVAKLPDGAPLPIGDTCDAPTATRECASGMCDPSSNACGAPKMPSVDASVPSDAGQSSPGAPSEIGPTYDVGGGCDASGADVGSLIAFGAALMTAVAIRRKKQPRN